MIVRPVCALSSTPLSVVITLSRHDDIGYAILREVRAHLGHASAGVGKNDYSRAPPTGECIVAPNGLELCKYFCVSVARIVWGEFDREVRGETVQSRGDETGHCWMVSLEVGGQSGGDSGGGEDEIEWIVEWRVCLRLVPVVTDDGRNGLPPRSGDVTQDEERLVNEVGVCSM
jgi:hypothetical protein